MSESLRQGHAAARAFRRAFGEDPWPETTSVTAVAVREYFHLRHAFDAQDWAALEKTKLDRFRDLRQRFTRNLDALHASWEIGGDDVLRGDIPSGVTGSSKPSSFRMDTTSPTS